MSMADVAEGLILAGLSAYLLFGGADFGAGLWHLATRREEEREVIEHAMGPVWEANHVWLIFVMVISWTAFPPVFADIMAAHWVPLSLAVAGIVVRGSAFVFGKAEPHPAFRWAFGFSSIVTPYCLGAVAGAVTTGTGNWISVAGVFTGTLTVALCAYLAAVYLTWDARRSSTAPVTARFRAYALTAGGIAGLVAIPGAAILEVRSPLIAVSAAAGLISLALLWRRAYVAVRLTAALAVVTVLWGAAAIADLNLRAAAASTASLQVVFAALAVGAVILLPSLALLYALFQRAPG